MEQTIVLIHICPIPGVQGMLKVGPWGYQTFFVLVLRLLLRTPSCSSLSTTLKTEVIKVLEYVLRWVGFGVRTPTSELKGYQDIVFKNAGIYAMNKFKRLS